ncbi:MAG: NAD(P)-dependent oxidoreductase [Phycisphaerae bacterium]|nr:NAD(P)-dependent oxidoreductase [Phycisphaerae bacterium]
MPQYHMVLTCVNHNCFVYALVHNNIRNELVELEEQNKIKIISADITSFDSLENAFNPIQTLDAVIHCAGRASDIGWDREFRQTNYESIKHLVKLTSQYKVKRLVFVSSTDVYGLKDFHGQNEQQLSYAEKANNPYLKYKIKAEKYLKANLPANQYCIIRPAAVWGKDDPTLTRRIKDFLAFSPYIIHFGKWKGQNRWPLAHVDNVALANYIGAFHRQACGIAINVLDEKKTTMDEFYRYVAKAYFPGRKYKSITLPFWLGLVIGSFVSIISNTFNLSHPFIDPSLYALYSVSKNLDFDEKLFRSLKESDI